jgi:hypothetical protein
VIFIFIAYVNYELKSRLFSTVWTIIKIVFDCMDSFREIIRQNSVGIRATAPTLIFIPQNKPQPHHTQRNGVPELHSVWPKRRMILSHRSCGGFRKISKQVYDLKCLHVLTVQTCSLSPNPEYNWWIRYWTSKPISVKHTVMFLFSFCIRPQSNLYLNTKCVYWSPYHDV